MKGYVQKALKEFLHQPPHKPVNGPTPYTAPVYGKSVQYAPTEEAKHSQTNKSDTSKNERVKEDYHPVAESGENSHDYLPHVTLNPDNLATWDPSTPITVIAKEPPEVINPWNVDPVRWNAASQKLSSWNDDPFDRSGHYVQLEKGWVCGQSPNLPPQITTIPVRVIPAPANWSGGPTS
eukprot:scaffold142601_cov51-Attheya_sp.AAC.1